MRSRQLPSVLQQDRGNSLSMERALKQIKTLLEMLASENWTRAEFEDSVNASIDDVETMLAAIKRD